jgi:hypothetical protein
MKPASCAARRPSFTLSLTFAALMTLAPRCASASEAEPEAHVAAALFTPARTDDGIHWDARFVLATDFAGTVAENETFVVRFAHPLPEGESLWLEAPFSGVPSIRGVYDSGRMIAVRVPGSLVEGRVVHARFVQRVAKDAGALVLGAPIAQGPATQIVEGAIGAGTRFELDEKKFERHVGYVTTRGVDPSSREEARRLTGATHGMSAALIYVRGDDVGEGIDARIVSTRDRAQSGFLPIVGVFAAIVAALLFALSRLRHAASVERADAILAADIEKS